MENLREISKLEREIEQLLKQRKNLTIEVDQLKDDQGSLMHLNEMAQDTLVQTHKDFKKTLNRIEKEKLDFAQEKAKGLKEIEKEQAKLDGLKAVRKELDKQEEKIGVQVYKIKEREQTILVNQKVNDQKEKELNNLRNELERKAEDIEGEKALLTEKLEQLKEKITREVTTW